jgi:ABC-2 type transport system permease protein
MFGKIAAFELRYQLKNPVFWVAVVAFFLLTFAAVTIDNVHIGDTANAHLNGPYAVIEMHLIWSIFFMFVSTAFVANVVVRDDETGFGALIKSTRVSKAAYLYGRFTGAFIAALLAFLAVPAAIIVGSNMPWLDPAKIGPFRPGDYLFAFGVMAAPTLFLTSAGFFALATVTRSMMATYVGMIAFLVLYTVTTAVAAKPEYMVPVAYIEPFGFGAFELVTRYFTAADRNSILPPLAGPLLFNRLIWTGVGALLLASAYCFFRFEVRGAKAGRKAPAPPAEPDRPLIARPSVIPTQFGSGASWAQFMARARMDFALVFKSPAFFVLLVLGLLNASGALFLLDGIYGVSIYPITRLGIETLTGSFAFIPLIVAIYYAGELVWRERDRKTEEIIDSTPTPDWTFVAPKVMVIALVFVAMLAVSIVLALAAQTIKHFAPDDAWKYVAWYLAPMTVSLTIFAVLAVFVQAVSPHKFIGWGVMVLLIIANVMMGNLGLEHNLYRYGGGLIGPIAPMSDMNGLGVAGVGGWWIRAYWGFIALILAVLAYGLWRRGAETRLSPRLRRLPSRLKGGAGALTLVALAGAIGCGGFVFLNTNVWNEYRTARGDERKLADYERTLLPYETVPQPKITKVKLDVDLHPTDAYADTHGVYWFQNKTDKPIATLHVRFDVDSQVRGLTIPGARQTKHYDRFNYWIFAFDTPMAPGETRQLSFETWRGQKGFRNNRNQQDIVDSGTFLNNFDIAPAIGMDRNQLIRDRAKRRRLGLPAELRMAKLEDVGARQFNALTKSADWVDSDITVTTDADQTPMAPGYRVSDLAHGDRRSDRFVTESPIIAFFSVQSARYAVKQDAYKGVNLSVYYYPGHPWNVDRIIRALKAGLDYDQTNFSPYQFRQVRVLEFPAYQGAFAQSFANTIPWSEDIGFTWDVRNPDKIDMVSYVAAHELGHQWWAHQVIPADSQGSSLLVETLAQYTALMTMKSMYGPDQIRKFLHYELDRYLHDRGGEAVEELPLARVENQPYIHYRKGSLVMYRLQDEIGEAAVNRALRHLLADHAFKGAPYPTSLDLIADLRAEAPADKQALITDLFEKITLYDLKTTKAVAKKRADGRYDLTLTISARKLYANGQGHETEAPMNETLDVGAFDIEPAKPGFTAKSVIDFERVAIHSGVQTVTLVVKRLPKFAGVDPYNKLIDRNADDNGIKVE